VDPTDTPNGSSSQIDFPGLPPARTVLRRAIYSTPRRVEGVLRLGIAITVSIGIPGLDEIRPGTHICALYSGPAERDRLLFPFLCEGIREGDKCLCLIDDPEVASSVRDRVAGRPGDDQPRRSEQLDVDRTSDAYLESGRFSVEHMRSFLAGRMILAAESDFPMVRAAGEMSWVLPQPGGANDFFVYESAINQIVEDMPAVFMCMYDLQCFGVSMLVDVLRAHPKVLLDRTVLDNPHCLTHMEGSAGDGSATTRYPLAKVPTRRARTASDPWRLLTDAELRIAELVAGGLTNRNIAEYLNLSTHTIDAHLKHVYVKLDIHSRVELTVLALQHH
jgi:DNA-binding CsgD family transcriptional regulator